MIFTCKNCRYPCVMSVDKKTVKDLKPVYCPIYGYVVSAGWEMTKEDITVDGKEYVAQEGTKDYYGGADNPYECIKVLEHWGLTNDYYISTAIAYLCRNGKKDGQKSDLEKAIWFLNKKIDSLERKGE